MPANEKNGEHGQRVQKNGEHGLKLKKLLEIMGRYVCTHIPQACELGPHTWFSTYLSFGQASLHSSASRRRAKLAP